MANWSKEDICSLSDDGNGSHGTISLREATRTHILMVKHGSRHICALLDGFQKMILLKEGKKTKNSHIE